MMQNTLTDIESIVAKYNGELKTYNSTWYNGHAYMPIHIYGLSINHKGWNIQLKYEYRKSEFSSSSMIDGGTFGDRHLFDMVGKKDRYTNSDFEILESGFLNKIFNKNAKLFRVKTKSAELEKTLSEDPHLLNIFNSANNDSEFSPLIVGKQKEQYYEISIRFNIRKINLLPVSSLFDFIFLFSSKDVDLSTNDGLSELPFGRSLEI